MKYWSILLIIGIALQITMSCSNDSSNDSQENNLIIVKATIPKKYDLLYSESDIKDVFQSSWSRTDKVLVYDQNNIDRPYIAVLTPSEINGNSSTLTGKCLSKPQGKVTLIRITKNEPNKYDLPVGFHTSYLLKAETDPSNLVEYHIAKDVSLYKGKEVDLEANVSMKAHGGILMLNTKKEGDMEIIHRDKGDNGIIHLPQGISYVSMEPSRFSFIYDGKVRDCIVDAGIIREYCYIFL